MDDELRQTIRSEVEHLAKLYATNRDNLNFAARDKVRHNYEGIMWVMAKMDFDEYLRLQKVWDELRGW